MELTTKELNEIYKGRCPSCLSPIKEIKSGPDHMNWVCVLCKTEYRSNNGEVRRTVRNG